MEHLFAHLSRTVSFDVTAKVRLLSVPSSSKADLSNIGKHMPKGTVTHLQRLSVQDLAVLYVLESYSGTNLTF